MGNQTFPQTSRGGTRGSSNSSMKWVIARYRKCSCRGLNNSTFYCRTMSEENKKGLKHVLSQLEGNPGDLTDTDRIN